MSYAAITMKLPEFASIAAGYAFSLLAGHFLTKTTVDRLWKVIGTTRAAEVLSTTQGLVERLLYTSAWLVGQPAFIAVWLALKVASQWKLWSERPGYNVFLVGSGLSILYAVTGALVVQWLEAAEWSNALAGPATLVIGTLLLSRWIAARTSANREAA